VQRSHAVSWHHPSFAHTTAFHYLLILTLRALCSSTFLLTTRIMLFGRILVLVSALLPFAAAQACAGSAKTGSASADKPFWMETIKHQGTAPYNGDASYKVFRNVKDFGAKGDGKTVSVPSNLDDHHAQCHLSTRTTPTPSSELAHGACLFSVTNIVLQQSHLRW
jgi:hypothetical protein